MLGRLNAKPKDSGMDADGDNVLLTANDDKEEEFFMLRPRLGLRVNSSASPMWVTRLHSLGRIHQALV